MLVLCCVMPALSSCSEQGLLFLAARGLLTAGLLLLQSMALGHLGSVVVAHGLSCSMARGIVPDQGSNLCPPH